MFVDRRAVAIRGFPAIPLYILVDFIPEHLYRKRPAYVDYSNTRANPFPLF
jgi:hypothetical protein